MSRNARRFVFTINDYDFTNDDGSGFMRAKPDCVRYIIWQHERVSRDHLQGYVRFSAPTSLGAVKTALAWPTAHIEAARGDEDQCTRYCSKPESHVAGPWTFGTPSGKECGASDAQQGSRSDLRDAANDVLAGKPLAQVAAERPATFVRNHGGLTKLQTLTVLAKIPDDRDINVTVIWGPTGLGKSRFAWDACRAHDVALFQLTYPASSAHVLWFPNYTGERALLLDEWNGQINLTTMNRLLDVYPYKVRCTGDEWRWAAWTEVFILANTPPDMWYTNPDPALWNAFRRRLTTVVEIRTRADLVALWEANGLPSHPRWRMPAPAPAGSPDLTEIPDDTPHPTTPGGDTITID